MSEKCPPGSGIFSSMLASEASAVSLPASSAAGLTFLAASRAFSASFLAASIFANTGASAVSGKCFS